jgi:hypothetical protein
MSPCSMLLLGNRWHPIDRQMPLTHLHLTNGLLGRPIDPIDRETCISHGR